MFIFTISFIAGLYSKAVLVLFDSYKKGNYLNIKLLLIIFLSIVGGLIMFGEGGSFNRSLLAGSFVFVCLMAAIFKDMILPKVNEAVILLHSIILLWFVFFLKENPYYVYFISISIIYFLVVGFISFLKVDISKSLQFLIGLSFVVVSIILTFLFFDMSQVFSYVYLGNQNQLNITTSIIYGFISFNLIANIFYVVILLGKKRYSGHEEINSIRNVYLNNVEVSNERLLLIILLGILLFLNSVFSFFDEKIFLSLILIIGLFISKSENSNLISLSNSKISLEMIILFISLIFVICIPFVLEKKLKNMDLSYLDTPSHELITDDYTENLNKEVTKNEEKVSDLIDLGLESYRRFDYKESENYYLQALEIDPNNKYARNNLGISLNFQGRFFEAEQEYLKSIEIDASYLSPLNNLGMLYQEIGDYDKSIIYFNKAIDLNPNRQTFLNIAKTYSLMGNEKESLKYYKLSENF
ncbi:MAG: hypothetical protein RLY43_647 [Bacteroidota bacterium]|jgi:tetratricopeptide (TPR) repeat protein